MQQSVKASAIQRARAGPVGVRTPGPGHYQFVEKIAPPQKTRHGGVVDTLAGKVMTASWSAEFVENSNKGQGGNELSASTTRATN